MSAAVTSVDSTTGGVQISWVAPNNGQDTITSYTIQIANAAGTTWTASASCDGASSTVILALKCIVPMSELTAAPYTLTFDSLVQVRIAATNSFGTSTWSTTNTAGARIRRIPDTMVAPTIVSYSDTAITVSWTALVSPANGNSDIVSYSLKWDNGAATTPSIELTNVLTTSYVVSGITPGTAY